MFNVIRGADNPLEYTHDELMESLKGNDEFTKYRTNKIIREEKLRILNGLISKEEQQ